MALTTTQLLASLLTVDGRANEGGVLDIPPNSRLLLDVIVEGSTPGDLIEGLSRLTPEVLDDIHAAAALGPTNDSATASFVTNPASATGAALAATYATVKTAQGGDETLALNAFLGAASPLGAKRLVGDFTVSGALTIPAGLYLDLTAATITQTSSGTDTLIPGTGATIVGGTLIGKGTDYVATTTPTPTAVGIRVNAAGVRVMLTQLELHANAGIYVNASEFSATSVRIEGVAGITTIPAGDAACFGIYINGGIRHSLTDVSVSDVSIGIIGPLGSTHLTMHNVRIWNVFGQHGVYLQDGTNLNISALQLTDIALHGLKVQLSSTALVDSSTTTITGVTADTCGDAAVILYNTATDLTSAKKFRTVSIANVSAANCSRALYLGSIRGGTIANITSRNAIEHTVVLVDVQDLLFDNILSEGSGRMGIFCISATGSASQRVTFRNTRIKSPAASNIASNVYGVYVNGSASDWSELTFDGLHISSGNAFMVYGFFFGAGDQETLILRNLVLSGATGSDLRLATGPRSVRELSNVSMTNTPLNVPTAIVTKGDGLMSDYFGNAAPTSGTWRRGDRVWNNAPAASGTIGWVCTAAGTPGTWKTFGSIAA